MLTTKEVEAMNEASYQRARDKRMKELEAENAALLKDAPPKAPDFAAIKSGDEVKIDVLNALHRKQRKGGFDGTPGLKEVCHRDATGRRSSHFFGDEGRAWAAFTGPTLKIGRIVAPR
jgi:hypothetical protein